MANDQKALSVEIDLTKPATVLIERVAEAVGVLYEPKRIVKKAEAEAQASRILALIKSKEGSVSERAVKRMVAEEVKKQINMEKILEDSLGYLSPDARPDEIDDDWLTNFFNHARNSSDIEMQNVWSRILSGETNQPGAFSKRTINLMAGLSKDDALSFNKLMNVSWDFGEPTPIVFDIKNEIYISNGVTFSSINRLSSIGLITLESLTGYVKEIEGEARNFNVSYQGTLYNLEVLDDAKGRIKIGKVLLTAEGVELARICGPENIKGFEEYVTEEFKKLNVELKKI